MELRKYLNENKLVANSFDEFAIDILTTYFFETDESVVIDALFQVGDVTIVRAYTAIETEQPITKPEELLTTPCKKIVVYAYEFYTEPNNNTLDFWKFRPEKFVADELLRFELEQSFKVSRSGNTWQLSLDGFIPF